MSMPRPYNDAYDHSQTHPLSNQVDSFPTSEFIPIAAANRRQVLDANGNIYTSADQAVATHSARTLLWSSEGYTNTNNIAVPALTATQKKNTNNSSVNLAAAAFHSKFALSTIDISRYHMLALVANLTAITGTSLQFELDMIDTIPATPVTIPIWKATALTAPGSILASFGSNLVAATAPTGVSTVFTTVPTILLPQVQIVWTATALTVATWTLSLYGIC